jgi:hypothetical protein
MIPVFPEREIEVCGLCGSRGPSDDLGSDGLCYPCHDAELERRAMEEEEEKIEDAYWRHVNNKIDEALGK